MAWATGSTHVGASGVYLNTSDDRSAGLSYLTFVFPQVRNLTGYFVYAEYGASNSPYTPNVLQVSTDTTDGTDGNWTTVASPWLYSSIAINPYHRSAIQAVTGADGIKGVRFAVSKPNANVDGNDRTKMFAVHLYGTFVGGNDGLRFWHPTNDVVMPPAHLDFGDIPQGSTLVKQFRLRNTSGQQANNIVVSAEAQTGSDAGLASGLTFSLDNVTYATTVTVPTLAGTTTSPVIYVRRIVGPAEANALRVARVKAVPGSWS
jgi:hypothetical protein